MTLPKQNQSVTLAGLFAGNGSTLQTILVVGIFAPILTALVALALSESVSENEARIYTAISNFLVASFFTITVVAIFKNKRLFSWLRFLISTPFLLGIFINLSAIILTLNGDRLQDIIADWKTENQSSSNHRSENFVGTLESKPLDESHTESNLKVETYIRSKFQPGSMLYGAAWNQSQRWPFSLTVYAIDNEGLWTGQIRWPTLESVNRVEGLISGSKIKFSETEKITPGKAAIGVDYVFELLTDRKSAEGVWIYKGSGNAILQF